MLYRQECHLHTVVKNTSKSPNLVLLVYLTDQKHNLLSYQYELSISKCRPFIEIKYALCLFVSCKDFIKHSWPLVDSTVCSYQQPNALHRGPIPSLLSQLWLEHLCTPNNKSQPYFAPVHML